MNTALRTALTATVTAANLDAVAAELNTAVSVVPARLARGSSSHNLAAYAARYADEAAELASEMALNPYTR